MATPRHHHAEAAASPRCPVAGNLAGAAGTDVIGVEEAVGVMGAGAGVTELAAGRSGERNSGPCLSSSTLSGGRKILSPGTSWPFCFSRSLVCGYWRLNS